MTRTMMVQQSHSCGEGCGCGKNNKKSETIAAVAARVQAIKAQVVALCAPRTNLTRDVAAELTKHPGVVASVNEDAQTVQTFLVPHPYFELTPEQRTALETERSELIDSLPRLGGTKRIRAQTRIRAIEADLGRDRSGRESERRDTERASERQRQLYGER